MSSYPGICKKCGLDSIDLLAHFNLCILQTPERDNLLKLQSCIEQAEKLLSLMRARRDALVSQQRKPGMWCAHGNSLSLCTEPSCSSLWEKMLVRFAHNKVTFNEYIPKREIKPKAKKAYIEITLD